MNVKLDHFPGENGKNLRNPSQRSLYCQPKHTQTMQYQKTNPSNLPATFASSLIPPQDGSHLIPSLKLTWHLKITQWKRRFLLETIIFLGAKMLVLESVIPTPLKFNIAPENGWLEYYFPIGMAYFQVLC